MIGEAINTGKNSFSIEDLLSEGFYLKCVNIAYGTNISSDELPIDGNDQISKRAEIALKQRGRVNELDKQLVLQVIQKEFNNIKTKNDLPQSTYEMSKELIAKINSIFTSEDQESQNRTPQTKRSRQTKAKNP